MSLPETIQSEVVLLCKPLCKVSEARHFWWLMDWLKHENSGFYHNRDMLLDYYKRGCLYTFWVYSNDMSAELHALCNPPGVLRSTSCLLPIVCVFENNACQIMWVATSFRRMGLATTMILKLCRELGINTDDITTSEQLESKEFWDSVGIKENANLKHGFC